MSGLLLTVVNPSISRARVASPPLSALIENSQVIVLARVVDLTGLSPHLMTASANVLEVWKGKPMSMITYRASPAFACDMSTATIGRTYLLFLEAGEGTKARSIAFAGRGQLLIDSSDGTPHAYLAGVVLPNELRSMDQLRPQKPAEALIPLDVLKSYVIRSMNKKKKASAQPGAPPDAVGGRR